MKAGLEKRIHCVGAAGAGMLPLAIAMSELGHDVTAQDDSMTEQARRLLSAAGVRIDNESWTGESNGIVVRSSAIGADSAELLAAEARGWTVMRRGECLAEIARSRKLIAIVGSHGKTTTSGMAIELMEKTPVDFDYLLGGHFCDGRSPGRARGAEWLVAEVDESDGTIEGFEPEVTVILNLDYDHHNQYPREEDYRDAFRRIAKRTKGRVIVGRDVSIKLGLREMDFGSRLLECGGDGDCSVSHSRRGVGMSRLELGRGESARQIDLNRSSAFNILNAAFACLAVSELVGLAGLPSAIYFSQLARRQACDFLSPRLVVLNDYAHHPREIEEYLRSVKSHREAPLHVVFQPHRYSRTRSLLRELSSSLRGCDCLYLLDVYAASEGEQVGGDSHSLLQACRGDGIDCRHYADWKILKKGLMTSLESEEAVVVFLGAGQTDGYAAEFSDQLAALDRRWGPVSREVGRIAEARSVIKGNEPLAKKTTMRVGGAAERYFEPASEAELSAVLRSCQEAEVPVSILGRGSNLIVPDEGVSGMVIRLGHPFWRQLEQADKERIWVGAGMRIKELCGAACRLGLAGFEFLEGIPGSVGGALRMNAGAMGGWTFDVVERVRFMAMDGTIYEKPIEELHYGYRHCKELVGTIAIAALLKSNESGLPRDRIRMTIDTYQGKRSESQPREPSAGCIFKNPDGDSAGRLVDELGLKGTAIGGAKVSEVHGNFVVNTGGATSQDVIELVKLVRRVAWREKRIDLEPEALLYGSQWEAVL